MSRHHRTRFVFFLARNAPMFLRILSYRIYRVLQVRSMFRLAARIRRHRNLNK